MSNEIVTKMDSSSAPNDTNDSRKNRLKNTSSGLNHFSATQYSKNYVLHLLSHFKFEPIVAGFSGGIVSTLILHPLDLVKIRQSVEDGQQSYRFSQLGLRQCLTRIYREEGLRGLYRGVTPNWIGTSASWGLYFFSVNVLKDSWKKPDEKELSDLKLFCVIAEAGIICSLVMNPIWVIKTRLCLQHAIRNEIPPSRMYANSKDALYKIYKYEGIRGLYKGLLPSLFGIAHNTIQFFLYEKLVRTVRQKKNLDAKEPLTMVEFGWCAAVSKIIAGTLTYPYQVVRSRLQDQRCLYKNAREVCSVTWRREGISGFYRGFTPYIVHVVPNIVAFFLVYESVNMFFKREKEKRL